MLDFDLYSLIIGIPVFLLSLSVHEFAHAFVADRLGDPTARWVGRLTIDPKAHIDPFGLLVLILTQRFGWAKPVPVNPQNFKKPRQGMLYVGIAGPIANMLIAISMALVIHAWKFFDPIVIYKFNYNLLAGYSKVIFDFVLSFLYTNIGLAVFNLLPFPPLDGSRVLAGIIPSKYAGYLDALEGNVGMIILIILAMTNWLNRIIVPIISFIVHLMRL